MTADMIARLPCKAADAPGISQRGARESQIGCLSLVVVPSSYHRTGETNGDSHLKNLLVHHPVILPITDGELDLGPWQQVY